MWRYLYRDIQEHRCHTLSFVKCMISVVSALELPHFCLNTKICTFGNDKINLSRDRRDFLQTVFVGEYIRRRRKERYFRIRCPIW